MDKELLKKEYGIEMWSEETIASFRQTLLEWYDKEKRDLPWRRTSDPYKIWVSEIMLQQTRVDTVIPYYENFLSEFPTVKELAEAPEDKLLKVWEGLGYYSRVRNMQEAAKQVMTQYDGVFPTEPKEIRKLKGIGPYTAGAISSIAFQHPEPAVDGNLMRVLSRLFEIDVDIAKASSRKVFEGVMRHIIDTDRPGDFNQALMDLGATICTPKNYDPSVSPIKDFNASYLNETWAEYPVKSKKKKAKPVTYLALLIQNEQGDFLLEKRPEKGLLANMWTFPLVDDHVIEEDLGWKSFEGRAIEQLDEEEVERLQTHARANYGVDASLQNETAGTVTHIFSHLKWTVYMYAGKVTSGEQAIPDNCEWVHPDRFEEYVFPVPQSKMWKEFQAITLF